MIEIMSFIGNAMTYESIVEVLKEAIKDIEANGFNEASKHRLAAACELYMVKTAIDMDGGNVMEFINDIKNRQRIGEVFGNKQ